MLYVTLLLYTMRIFCYDYRADADVDGYAGHELNLVQQLNLELSQKNMIFPNNCIKVSKVVGQGDTCTVYACPCAHNKVIRNCYMVPCTCI